MLYPLGVMYIEDLYLHSINASGPGELEFPNEVTYGN